MDSEFLVSKWKDPSYRGCFTGVTTFTNIINEDYKLGLTRKQILEALSTIPSFVDQINTKRRPEKRKYDITTAFDTWTMDLAFLKKYGLNVGFLLCVDIGSRRIYTRPITSKLSAGMVKRLESIFKDDCDGFSPQKILTDAGAEFVGLKGFFQKYNIYHKIIRTNVKASIAERYIGIVKERIIKAMDTLQTKNWPKLLPDIVRAINSTENKAVGGLKPIEIETPFDNVKLQKKIENRKYQQPHWYDQMKNQQKYEKNQDKIQVGDWVLANAPMEKSKKLHKGYKRKVRQVYYQLLI